MRQNLIIIGAGIVYLATKARELIKGNLIVKESRKLLNFLS